MIRTPYQSISSPRPSRATVASFAIHAVLRIRADFQPRPRPPEVRALASQVLYRAWFLPQFCACALPRGQSAALVTPIQNIDAKASTQAGELRRKPSTAKSIANTEDLLLGKLPGTGNSTWCSVDRPGRRDRRCCPHLLIPLQPDASLPFTPAQSAAQYNAWLADKYPPQTTRIADLIKQGKWEIVGGMWSEPDLNMPDGESLTRQLLIGKRVYKRHSIDVRIGWNRLVRLQLAATADLQEIWGGLLRHPEDVVERDQPLLGFFGGSLPTVARCWLLPRRVRQQRLQPC